MSARKNTCTGSGHFWQKLPIQLLNAGVQLLELSLKSSEASHAVYSKLRIVSGNDPARLRNAALFTLETEFLELGACTSGTRRSHQKSAADPKIVGMLSKLLCNVRVPELQATVNCGGNTVNRLSMLRL